MKAVLVALGALLLAVSCGSPIPRAQGPLPKLGSGLDLFVAGDLQRERGVAILDAGSGLLERRLPMGVLSADGKRLFAPQGESLQILDSGSGTQVGDVKLPRRYELPPATLGGLPGGLSPNGRWLVLQAVEPLRTQAPPRKSLFAVVDTTLKEKPKTFEADGFYEFDAVNNAGSNLYLIHHQPGSQNYKVEVYDLVRNRLTGYSVTDKTEPNEPMYGTRLSGVFSPDGAWLYSVYMNTQKGPFIHALNLNDQYAWCIDLPTQGKGSVGQFMWSLALNPGGSKLYAANAALGLVSEIPLGTNGKPKVTRTASVGAAPQARSLFWKDAEAKRLVSSAAAISPDGRTLYFGDTDLVALDTASLQVRSRSLSSWRLQSLAASPDGTWLFVVGEDGRVGRVEMATGRLAQEFGTGMFPMGFVRVSARP